MKKLNNIYSASIFLLLFTLAFAQSQNQSIVVKGKILSSDGLPIEMSHVHGLIDGDYNYKKVLTRAKKDGSFEIKLEVIASQTPLFFTGVHHYNKQVMVLPGLGDYELEIRLEPIIIDENAIIESIKGNHNDYYPLGTIEFEKETKGKYRFDKARFPEGMTHYQVTVNKNGVKVSMAGPLGKYEPKTKFFPDDDGYASEISDHGDILAIDKRKYAHRHTGNGGITYSGQDGIIQKIADEAIERINNYLTELSMRAMAAQASSEENKKFQVMDLQAEFDRLVRLIQSTEDERLKQIYLLEYFGFDAIKQMVQVKEPGDYSKVFNANADPAIIRQLVQIVPPTTSLWALEMDRMVPWLVQILEDSPENEAYINQIRNEHPLEYFRIGALYGLANRYHDNGNQAEFTEAIGRLLSEYPNSYFANRARKQYKFFTNLTVGQDVPDFRLTSLDDPAIIITPQSLLGRTYLIDFWATWCGGCIQAMPTVQKLYDKYKNRGFEVLNISLDNKMESIDYFREKRYPLPWLNAWEKDGFKSELAKKFEIHSIPMKVLVGSDGKIIEMGNDLSNNLEHILKTHFNK